MDKLDKLKFEIYLLKMWSNSKSFEKVYKYKNRIRAFRQPLTDIDLFYDLTYLLFEDIIDTADSNKYYVEDYVIDIDTLLNKRYSELNQLT